MTHMTLRVLAFLFALECLVVAGVLIAHTKGLPAVQAPIYGHAIS